MNIYFTGVTTLYMHVQYTFTNCDIFECLNCIEFYYWQRLTMKMPFDMIEVIYERN